MNNSPSDKALPSLPIEELLQLNHHPQQQNWLLTYVDVFILIIMLVITLIALSDFDSELKQKKDTSKTSKAIRPAAITKPSMVAPVLNKAPPSQPPAVKEEATKPLRDTSNLAEKTKEKTIVSTNKQSLTAEQVKDNKLQQKFMETINELGLIDSVSLKMTLGYAQLEIQDKILFKSSEASLLNAGKSLLQKLTILLKQSTGLIYIEGHTDDRPIKTVKFPSNWELGAARATSVLHFLASQELNVTRLRAVTYGSTKPIADNKTKIGREKNRRVSLVIKVSDRLD